MDGEPIEEDVLLLKVVVERIVFLGLELYVERRQKRREAFDMGGTVVLHQSAEDVGYISESLEECGCVSVAGGDQRHVAGVEGEACRVVVADGV